MARVKDKSDRMSAQEPLELWQAYKRTGDQRVRDRLVLTFAPMVKYIVYKKAREIPARCEVEDFISCGLEALIRSIDRYDPNKGATLEQFAWTRIHGAPRSLRRWDRDINKASEQFVGLYGRRPSKQELSESLGISTEDLVTRQDEIARSHVGSLNTVLLAEDDTTIERIDTLHSGDSDNAPAHAAMREDAKARFRQAFERLPERERKVAVLLYV